MSMLDFMFLEWFSFHINEFYVNHMKSGGLHQLFVLFGFFLWLCQSIGYYHFDSSVFQDLSLLCCVFGIYCRIVYVWYDSFLGSSVEIEFDHMRTGRRICTSSGSFCFAGAQFTVWWAGGNGCTSKCGFEQPAFSVDWECSFWDVLHILIWIVEMLVCFQQDSLVSFCYFWWCACLNKCASSICV